VNRHLVIPDTQLKPGCDLKHIAAAGKFIDAKRPEVIVVLGDWGDFGSLSSYDKGKASAENRRLSKDWDVFRLGLEVLLKPWIGKSYNPRLIYTEGNHEQRIQRYANDNPALDTLPDPCGYFRDCGFAAYPFLHEVVVDGVRYCHLFARTSTGRVTDSSRKYGAPTALAMARANAASCTAGHKPGFDYAELPAAGRTFHGLICGSFYRHEEHYQTVQGNRYFRGLVLKNRVRKGEYDLCKVNINYLLERYK
jgi:hypothetical protein